MHLVDCLGDIRWIPRLEGERLPAASYALLSNLKNALFFYIGGTIMVVVCFQPTKFQPFNRSYSQLTFSIFVKQRRPFFFCQTPGRRPPHITLNLCVVILRRYHRGEGDLALTWYFCDFDNSSKLQPRYGCCRCPGPKDVCANTKQKGKKRKARYYSSVPGMLVEAGARTNNK